MAENGITIRLEGVARTRSVFERLEKRTKRTVARKATRAASTVMTKAMRLAAPRQSGLFRRSLTSRIVSYGAGARLVAVLGQQKNKSFGRSGEKVRDKKRYGGISGRGELVPIHLVESPTEPHRIPRAGRNKGPLVFRTAGGRFVVVASAMHPGTRGAHFMRRAATQATAATLRAFDEKFETETLAAAGRGVT